MHLDDELRALRPRVGRPSAATVAGHRRALDTAIASGRTESGRGPGSGDGRPRWLLTVAAALAVVVAGGLTWWAATTRGDDDVRLDTGPAASPATDADTPATVTAPPATTVLDAAGQSTPTVTFAPGSGGDLACGPVTPTGDMLPAFLQLLPYEPEAASGRSTFDAEGRLITRRESERVAVEAMWPAPDRQLYAAEGQDDGVGRSDLGISYGLSSEGQTELIVKGSTGEFTALKVLTSGALDVAGPCRYIQFTVSEQGRQIARFTYDLATGDGQPALVNRGPLVTESRQVAEAPAVAAPCGGADANGAPPNEDQATQGPVAATPAQALEAFLTTPPAATYLSSGYVEMITPDGTHVYGVPIEPGDSDWVTLVTVTPLEGGWAATHVTASGC